MCVDEDSINMHQNVSIEFNNLINTQIYSLMDLFKCILREYIASDFWMLILPFVMHV